MYDQLEKRLGEHVTKADAAHENIEKKLDSLRDNHIYHLSLDIGLVKKDMWWIKLIGGFVILQAVGLIVAIFLK